MEGGVHLPELLAPLAQLKGHVKVNKRPPRIATRGMRGPLLLKCQPVVYDADANRLSLPPGVFVGFDVHRETKEEDHDDEEYENTVIGGKESDLAGTAIFGENMDNSYCYGNTLKSPHSVQTRQNSSIDFRSISPYIFSRFSVRLQRFFEEVEDLRKSLICKRCYFKLCLMEVPLLHPDSLLIYLV